MAKKQLFADLKQAIAGVLLNCYTDIHNPNHMLVHKNALYILQEEYNIHFVEPTDNQIRIIETLIE